MSNHIDLGKEGEKIVRKFLEERGCKIRETNWRAGKAEIDIIAEDRFGLLIVEVKTRRNNTFILPEASVDVKKQQLLLGAAAKYMHDTNWQGECRFDVAVVILDKHSSEVTYFEDAFFPNPTDDVI